MELEEAIENLVNESVEYANIAENIFEGKGKAAEECREYAEAIRVVLTYLTKQDKMIELMTEYIMYKVPFIKETRCLELKEDARTLNSVKKYFEKKAEENL